MIWYQNSFSICGMPYCGLRTICAFKLLRSEKLIFFDENIWISNCIYTEVYTLATDICFFFLVTRPH